MRAGSLSRRLFLATSVFAVVAVMLIAFALNELYRANAERRFAELLTANLYNLMGSVEPDENGDPSGRPDLRDPRYSRFASGWYWSVSAVADPEDRITSRSLAEAEIPVPGDVAFDTSFQRSFTYVDTQGQQLTAVEAQVFLGAGDKVYSFKITGNRDQITEEIQSFTRSVVLMLGLFAIGFVAASYAIVTFGLRPIAGATRSLLAIRDGSAEQIEGEYPREIQPLIEETNALINSNRAIIERARTQVGNLAHSLKTPIAVMRNEAEKAKPELKSILLEQTELMRHQVENYLNRARIAARHGTVISRTEIGPAADRLVRVMKKLHPGLEIGFEQADAKPLLFAGEQQDFEEILGNLLENACRFAKTKVRMTCARITTESDPSIQLEVHDDGPGMTSEQAEIAMRRGVRLDETAPGSGLGLSIVRDIVAEYEGRFRLDRSELGGLKAVIFLPGR